MMSLVHMLKSIEINFISKPILTVPLKNIRRLIDITTWTTAPSQ